MISIHSVRTALPPVDEAPHDDAPVSGPPPPVIVPRLPTEEDIKQAMQALREREMASVQHQIADHLSPPVSDVPNTSPAVLADPLDVQALDPRTLAQQLGKSAGAGDVGESNDPVIGSPPVPQLSLPSGDAIAKALQEQRERQMQSVEHQDRNAADLLFAAPSGGPANTNPAVLVNALGVQALDTETVSQRLSALPAAHESADQRDVEARFADGVRAIKQLLAEIRQGGDAGSQHQGAPEHDVPTSSPSTLTDPLRIIR